MSIQEIIDKASFWKLYQAINHLGKSTFLDAWSWRYSPKRTWIWLSKTWLSMTSLFKLVWIWSLDLRSSVTSRSQESLSITSGSQVNLISYRSLFSLELMLFPVHPEPAVYLKEWNERCSIQGMYLIIMEKVWKYWRSVWRS